MIYLFLSILCSVAIGFVMKFFPRYKIDTLQAIVVNYATCVTCATFHKGESPIKIADMSLPWWPYAIGLGLVFITGFNGAASTVKHYGLTVAAIVQKMSIALSVPFAILVYHESAGLLKVLGILCAVGSILLTNLKEDKPKDDFGVKTNKVPNLIWIPIITFLLSVVIEIVFLKVNHEKWLPEGDVKFIATIFGTAGFLGFAVILWRYYRKIASFSLKNVVAGIALGIPNYGSILFIFLALGNGVEGSVFFPANNVGIIVLSALLAVGIFHEKLSKLNWTGVALAIAAILLIAAH